MKLNNRGINSLELIIFIIIACVGIYFLLLPTIRNFTGLSKEKRFMSSAMSYIKEAQKEWEQGDTVVCTKSNSGIYSMNLGEGLYYMFLETKDDSYRTFHFFPKTIKSPWNGKELTGYVKIKISNNKKPVFSVFLTDGAHTLNDVTYNEITEKNIKSKPKKVNVDKDKVVYCSLE